MPCWREHDALQLVARQQYDIGGGSIGSVAIDRSARPEATRCETSPAFPAASSTEPEDNGARSGESPRQCIARLGVRRRNRERALVLSGVLAGGFLDVVRAFERACSVAMDVLTRLRSLPGACGFERTTRLRARARAVAADGSTQAAKRAAPQPPLEMFRSCRMTSQRYRSCCNVTLSALI